MVIFKDYCLARLRKITNRAIAQCENDPLDLAAEVQENADFLSGQASVAVDAKKQLDDAICILDDQIDDCNFASS